MLAEIKRGDDQKKSRDAGVSTAERESPAEARLTGVEETPARVVPPNAQASSAEEGMERDTTGEEPS